jgi:hypothetical protein
MNVRLALRTLAMVIAVAGVVDPVATVSRPTRQPLTIAILDSSSDGAYAVAARVKSGVSNLYDTTVRLHPVWTAASPCPVDGACVVMSEGVAPRRISTRGPLSAVRISPSRTPTVAIKSGVAATTLDPDARGVISVELETKDPSPLVRVFDESLVVGQSTTGRIEWTPVGRGVRQLRIATLDDEAYVAVEVTPQRHKVLFYEPRPTWMGTFVRRALEVDPRFALQTRARVANAISVSTGNVPLDTVSLEREDPRVVVVSALDQLTANEVAALDAFMTRRGGSVVALLDVVPGGPGRALLPVTFRERREAQPVAVAQLKGSEFVTMTGLDAGTTALASVGDAAVIASRAVGNGRIVASGASDAWRFRGDGTFNAHWQSLIADAADAAGDALSIVLNSHLARLQESVRVNVEWRPLRPIDATIDARATLTCGNTAQPIRLWPDGAPGRFAGELDARTEGPCRVSATLNNVSASTPLLVRDVRTARAPDTDLATAITAHGGTVVNSGDEETLITMLRGSASPRDMSTRVHPMRSPLWIIPFAACLGGEWWLRRRGGHS